MGPARVGWSVLGVGALQGPGDLVGKLDHQPSAGDEFGRGRASVLRLEQAGCIPQRVLADLGRAVQLHRRGHCRPGPAMRSCSSVRGCAAARITPRVRRRGLRRRSGRGGRGARRRGPCRSQASPGHRGSPYSVRSNTDAERRSRPRSSRRCTSRAATAPPASWRKCFTNIEHLEFDSFRTPPGSVASSRRAQVGAASPLVVWAESLAQGFSFGEGEAYADMVPLAAFIVVAVTLTGCSSHDKQPTGSGIDTSRARPPRQHPPYTSREATPEPSSTSPRSGTSPAEETRPLGRLRRPRRAGPRQGRHHRRRQREHPAEHPDRRHLDYFGHLGGGGALDTKFTGTPALAAWSWR